MIFAGFLIVVSTLVCDLCEGFSDTRFVMIKGGLSEDITVQLLRSFHSDRPSKMARIRNESRFCGKQDDEKAGMCVRAFGIPEVRNIVEAEYNPQSHLNQFNLSSYQCRKRKIIQLRSGLMNAYRRMPKGSAKFIRCPTSPSKVAELRWSDLYLTIDHKGGYYLFGAPWGDDYAQPIAHIEKQIHHHAFPRLTHSNQNTNTITT